MIGNPKPSRREGKTVKEQARYASVKFGFADVLAPAHRVAFRGEFTQPAQNPARVAPGILDADEIEKEGLAALPELFAGVEEG